MVSLGLDVSNLRLPTETLPISTFQTGRATSLRVRCILVPLELLYMSIYPQARNGDLAKLCLEAYRPHPDTSATSGMGC